MRTELILAAAAGLCSGLLFAALASQTFSGIVLANGTMFPLFVAGLGLGLPGALVAAVSGLVVTAVIADIAQAIFYAVAFVVPVVVLTRQALLSRQAASGIVWYPTGLLLSWLAGLGAAMALYWMWQLSHDEAAEALRRQLAFMLRGSPVQSGEQSLPSNADAIRLASWILGYLPGMIAASWMLTIIINGAVALWLLNSAMAQGVLRRFGRSLRPSPVMAEIQLPLPLVLLFIAMVIVAMLPDGFGYVGRTFAMVLGVPLLLQGLGVIHAFAAQVGSPGFMLAAIYLLLVISGVAVPLVVILGLIEQWAHLRRRIGPAGPDQENEG